MRSIGEIGPRAAVPEQDSAIGDAGVGAAAMRVECYALGALDLVKELDFRPLKEITGVPLGRHLGPRRHVHLDSLEVRKAMQGAVVERVQAAVQGGEQEYSGKDPGRRHRHRSTHWKDRRARCSLG